MNKTLAAVALLTFSGAAQAARPAKEVRIPEMYRAKVGDGVAVEPAKITVKQKLSALRNDSVELAKGIPSAFRANVIAKIHAPGAWRRISKLENLDKLSDAELGQLGKELLDTPTAQRLLPGEHDGLLAQLDRVLTAHGDDPGDQLDILSHMELSESDANKPRLRGLEDRIESVFHAVRGNIEGKGFGPEYAALLKKLGVVSAKGTYTVYPDGPKAFTRIFGLMDEATRAQESGRKAFIINTTFTLKPDYIGTRFAAQLRRFARAGGPAYSIYEPAGSNALVDGTPVDVRIDRGPEKTLAERPNGGMYLPDGKLDKRTFYTRIASPKGLFKDKVHLISTEEHPLEDLLSHRKATIIGIEDEQGEMQIHLFNGDMNDSDEHILWRGVHHEITGPAVEASVDNMIELWQANAHTPLPADVVAMMKAPQPEKPGMVDIETIGHRGRADQTIKNTFLASIEAMPANGHYIVAAPYNYDPDEFRATVDAAKRIAAQQKQTGGEGHPPVILMPMHNDEPSIAEAFESAIPELVKAGVEVRYYNGAKYWNGFSHSKRGMIFYSDPSSLDANGKPELKGIAYNGTSNWDRRSTLNNWEETHLVSDKASLTALAQTFADDIKESVLVTVDAKGKVVVGSKDVPDKREILDKLTGHFEGLL